jgi:hypothetical protein
LRPLVFLLGIAVIATTNALQQPAPARLLLAEVLYDPAEGDTAWVELLNAGQQPADLVEYVLRVDTMEMPLPRLESPLAPGARLLVRFDGRSAVEPGVIHASSEFAVQRNGSVVVLLTNTDHVLDRIAWGDAEDAFVPSIGGLAIATPVRGSTIGRPPSANRAQMLSDWTLYPPDQASPGAPNPLPAVSQLLPLNGAILEATSTDLHWYPVPGAMRYRVQLARDSAFAEPLLDQVVEGPPVSSGERTRGSYWWRVQAMADPGQTAAWSNASRLELGAPEAGDDDGGADGNDAPSSKGPNDNAKASSYRIATLNVPLLIQHKDSRMLHLELEQEGTRRTAARLPRVPHAWDRDHGTLDPLDPTDNKNCALASTAMINRFYGGNLTQDRIGYEMWSRNVQKYNAVLQHPNVVPTVTWFFGGPPPTLREAAPGPEKDLHMGQGAPWARLMAATLFALGSVPAASSAWLAPIGSATPDNLWNTIVAEIDAGRPVMGFQHGHAVVIRGYQLNPGLNPGRRILFINDPWTGRYRIDFDTPLPFVRAGFTIGTPIEGVWTFPRPARATRQEPEVSTDADVDGVVDFDETERFRTDPRNPDTDGDGVRDKEDIQSGVYELKHPYGYAYAPGPQSRGRDLDLDGTPTELDPDSDNGGCKDGDEDTDGSGAHGGSETDNFDRTDDVCGSLDGSLHYDIQIIGTDPDQLIDRINESGLILVRLKPSAPGSVSFVDDGSTFDYNGFARIQVILGPGCVMWGRERALASRQTFLNFGEIGATVGDDGTLALGAHADVPSTTASAGCGGPAGTRQGERTMSFPDCNGSLVSRAGGVRRYTFSCTTPPNLGPGLRVISWSAGGYVNLR